MEQPKTRRENEIWQACDDLWAQHATLSKITGDAIRDQIVMLGYKKGSPNEIYKFRKTWQLSRGISNEQAGSGPESNPSDPIGRAVSLVYEQIHTQAQEEIAELKATHQAEIEALQKTHEELKATHETVLGEKADLLNEQDRLQKINQTLEKTLSEKEKEQATTLERLKTTEKLFEQHRTDTVLLLAEIKSFQEKEVDLWRNQIKELKNEKEKELSLLNQKLKEQGHAFSEELSSLKVENRNLLTEKEKTEYQAKTLQEKHEETLTELQITSKELGKQRAELKQMEQKYHGLEQKQVVLQAQAAIFNKQKSQNTSDFQKLHRHVENLLEQMKSVEQRVIRFTPEKDEHVDVDS